MATVTSARHQPGQRWHHGVGATGVVPGLVLLLAASALVLAVKAHPGP